jgi:threonylcarbamoyladenosine tRNA methylthiotransferase MtaB
MRILIKTLGCKANRYESDKLVETLKKKHEIAEELSSPNVLIVNTCTVTQVADRKSRQVVFGFKRLFPAIKVIVFGCGSNVAPEEYKKLEGVDFVAKNTGEVLRIIGKVELDARFRGHDIKRGHDILSRTRAVLKIQDGCNNFCTYCIIPRARGPEVSYPSKKILAEIKKLEKEGYKEIVLTGITLGAWNEEIPAFAGMTLDIADLIEMMRKNTKDVRFRISSLEPKNFSKKFYSLFATGRLCPHIHMSLQSGCDSILKRMRRNYSTKEFFEICKKFRKAVPDIGLTTDVIVGFPGETDEEFEKTCKFVQKIGFLKIHTFPYSKRKNTPAYFMKDQIPEDVKKTRAEKLRKIADKMSLEFKKSLLGKTYEILVENPRGDIYHGFTPNYIPVQFSYTGKSPIVRQFKKVTLKKILPNGTVMAKLV